MSILQGRAKKYDGSKIDYVSIFNWPDGKCIAQAVPDSSGAWKYHYFESLNVGVTYVADGCQPITHGPYAKTPIAARYWRVARIVNRRSSQYWRSVGQLVFICTDGTESYTPANAISESVYDAESTAGKAFDGTNDTFAASASLPNGTNNEANGLKWWIGYVFDTPKSVISVKAQMRSDMPDISYDGDTLGQEWQSFTVQYSEDGISWIDAISFPNANIPKDDITIKTFVFAGYAE